VKFGFYGNANNYPFMLALALKRLGHEVLFIVLSPDPLCRPESRYPEIRWPYPPWICDLSGPPRWRYLLPGLGRKRVLSLLNTCDFAVLNEEGPALASALSVPHLVLLTGSNLELFADHHKASILRDQLLSTPSGWARFLNCIFPTAVIRSLLTTPQRRGIRDAELVTFFPRGLIPNGDRLLAEIGVQDSKRMDMLIADLHLNSFVPPPTNPVLRVFNVSRFTWKAEPETDLTDLDYKASDVMIRGIGSFRRKHRIPLDLRFVRKGRHIAESVKLVGECGLADQVTWLDELTQLQVRDEYSKADVVFDQLGNGAVAMGGLEAMAIGRPLIANGRPEIFERLTGEVSPICQARTPEEVCAQLARLARDPAERERVGLASWRYVEKHFSSDAAARQILTRLGPSPAAAQ
jgi:glycosyltransferase involved in cell wall biosynthesis